MGLWEDTVAVKLESIENSYFTYIPARYLKKKEEKTALGKSPTFIGKVYFPQVLNFHFNCHTS